MISNPEKYLITANGRIKCIRCKARSVHTKKQCGNPALKDKTVCKWHGGMSTGPKTEEGIQRIRDAQWKHGNETKEAKAKRRKKSLAFATIEKIGLSLGSLTGNKTRGRKPKDLMFYDLNNIDDLIKALELIKKN